MVTEYQWHNLISARFCGEATRASGAGGRPDGGGWAETQATAALCTGASHVSKRTRQGLLSDRVGVEVSRGTISNLEQATERALGEPVQGGPSGCLEEHPVA